MKWLRSLFSQELRGSPRYEVHYPAHIEIPNGQAVVNCVIWDISASGAKLTVAIDQPLPEDFVLLFRRRCRLVRRTESQVAVQLSSAFGAELGNERDNSLPASLFFTTKRAGRCWHLIVEIMSGYRKPKWCAIC